MWKSDNARHSTSNESWNVYKGLIDTILIFTVYKILYDGDYKLTWLIAFQICPKNLACWINVGI